MGKGKVAAQCAHAAVAAYKIALMKNPLILKYWGMAGNIKITLKADDENALKDLAQKAKKANLITKIIQDAGRTQILQGSRTVCVIGPGPSKLVDEITGMLKLY
ncbi:Peptidyl-tRNA hydrolase 2, mitochondrial [Harpegnathos saltator]|uniref:peptidyl-tRNA hydrolase n=2 Tax=Harpegnathos saltator TaxID=610380 RepID=E2BIE7_HARSA|nr:Peptidyl-tRNA hydrolase 2, mitochondrial [Harpegnathos saltator]